MPLEPNPELEWLLSEKLKVISLIKACPPSAQIERMSLEARLWNIREELGEVFDPEDEELTENAI